MSNCKNCNVKIIAYNYVNLKKDTYCLHCTYVSSIKKQENFKKTIDNKIIKWYNIYSSKEKNIKIL